MLRPFYSAPAKLRPEFPLLPGAVRLPPPHVLTGGTNREPPPPGAVSADQSPTTQSPFFNSDKPWMTAHILAEIRRRNHLQRVAASWGSEEHLAAAESARQTVNRLVNDAKERFCLAHPERTDEILQTDRQRRPHHCAACDRSYTSREQLEQHCQQHVRCGLDDCPFTAHPLIVEKHVTMQHHTGLAKVIMSLNTPEAIQKWRQERRARFCRPETAALRQKQQAERMARGMRMGSGRGRFPPAQQTSGGGASVRRRGGRAGGRWPARAARPVVTELDSDSGDEPGPGIRPFAGILSVGDESFSHSDQGRSAVEVVVRGVEPVDNNPTSHTAPALPAGLERAGSTGSQLPDMGDAHEPTLLECKEKATNSTAEMDKAASPGGNGPYHIPQRETLSSEQKDREDISSSPGRTVSKTCSGIENGISGNPVFSNEDPIGPANSATDPDVASADVSPARGGSGRRGRHRRRRDGGSEPSADRGRQQQPPRKRRRRLTLLEKLLAPQIERERNIILQCVRYIRRNEFFDGLLMRTAAAQPEAEAESVADDPVPPVPETTPVCVTRCRAEPSTGQVNGGRTESVNGGATEDVEGGSVTGSAQPDDAQQSSRAAPGSTPKAAEKAHAEPETGAGGVEVAGALRLLGAAYDSDAATDSE